jgi:putative ABC transport system substrate-binding protein
MVQRRRFSFAMALACVRGARAQPTKVFRVGVMFMSGPGVPGAPKPLAARFRGLGYVEGEQILIERRFAVGDSARFAGFAAELVALNPDVIIAETTPAALAAKRASASIPIVFVNVSDPVASGLVVSLARPGGNVTGITDFGIEIAAKYFEILHTLAPNAKRISVWINENPVHSLQLDDIKRVARRVSITVLTVTANASDRLEDIFDEMTRQKADAFIVLGGGALSTRVQQDKLVQMARAKRLPALYPSGYYVEKGGLCSFSMNVEFGWKATVGYVDRILKGARPSDLPVQQPSEFELVLNRGTAKALDLEIPRSLLIQANQVIE